MSEPEPIIALHQYCIWANRMREHFDRALKAAPKNSGHFEFADDLGLFVSYCRVRCMFSLEGSCRTTLR